MPKRLPRDGFRTSARSGERNQLAIRAKYDALFKGTHFRYIREIHLPEGKVFVNPLGWRGRHGHIIQNTTTGEYLCVGLMMLRTIANTYNAIVLPDRIKYVRKRHTMHF